jgi:hypothetical protein
VRKSTLPGGAASGQSGFVDVTLLVDGIVRQTMVLIAQLSTTSGQRAALTHVADRVFLDLVAELERQRLGKKVIADMFGLALRSYQQKVQRLSESATESGRTLWAAVFEFLREREVASKLDVLGRFSRDDETSVRGILTDLVDSGLVYQSGRGDGALYRIAGADDWARTESGNEARTLFAWSLIYRDGPVSVQSLAGALRVEPDVVPALVAPLVADGRVAVAGAPGAEEYSAASCVIPLGAAVGFEAAVLDHFRAVATALAAKLRGGARRSAKDDVVGGSTFTFELAPGHPLEGEVRGTLARVRQELVALWERVAEENRRKPVGDEAYRVTSYVGQHVEEDGAREEQVD